MPSDDRNQPPPSERFATLDEYLAWRRSLGASDAPYYEEVRPGVYRLKSGRASTRMPEPLFTREDLQQRYGFKR